MSSSTLQSFSDIGEIVDLDFHLVESESELVPYLESPFDEMLSRPGIAETSNYNQTKFLLDGVGGDIGPEVAPEPGDMKEVMADLGIDLVTLNPGLNLNLVTVHNDRYAVALASAYNEWVAETFLDASEGMYGTMRICPRFPDRAVEEIETWRDTDEFVGVMLGPTGFMNPLGHPRFDDVWAALEDAPTSRTVSSPRTPDTSSTRSPTSTGCPSHRPSSSVPVAWAV